MWTGNGGVDDEPSAFAAIACWRPWFKLRHLSYQLSTPTQVLSQQISVVQESNTGGIRENTVRSRWYSEYLVS
ncbi:hypothetical protein BABINDRAFT_161490 [Babjeviella inositovora NRRL Y-12698]|uniref:Uncharacterized protein n=1 Tax=Babjeviella inositovora NRRL Y-12698 TaxID=984486 RepID=A0A1E3QQ11_9ASCO|nr:uncharacterized protein BABINDRAFT_161490 [Babjeviella inositovora NRRL Y-12698]ODQ79796.1 hypothetical protein BABINDRAFT_161490 [Babjeviella inositovora NRRL Y-12698]